MPVAAVIPVAHKASAPVGWAIPAVLSWPANLPPELVAVAAQPG